MAPQAEFVGDADDVASADCAKRAAAAVGC